MQKQPSWLFEHEEENGADPDENGIGELGSY
jgi:hypothetical protein